MGSTRSQWGWRAVRIITFAVMAVVLFVSAIVLWGRLVSDLDLAIAGLDVARNGRMQTWLSPLVPVGLALFLAAGLAIVHYSRRPPVKGSYLTPRALAVGAAVALLAVAAWPVFSCALYEWTHLGPPLQPFGEPPAPSVGCYGLDHGLGPLLLGCLLLVLAAFLPRSLWLGAVGGGLVGLVVCVLVLAPFVWGLGLWWLPLLLGAVGVAAGSWFASHHAGSGQSEDDRLLERRGPAHG